MDIVKGIDKYSEPRKAWRIANKDKVAQYARTYYHKRAEIDPTYKTLLCEKKKATKQKKRIEKCINVKAVGRPRQYPMISDAKKLSN